MYVCMYTITTGPPSSVTLARQLITQRVRPLREAARRSGARCFFLFSFLLFSIFFSTDNARASGSSEKLLAEPALGMCVCVCVCVSHTHTHTHTHTCTHTPAHTISSEASARSLSAFRTFFWCFFKKKS